MKTILHNRDSRSKIKTEDLKKKAAELYLLGHTQRDIGAQLNIDQARVSRLLKRIRQDWFDETQMSIQEYMIEESTKLKFIEKAAWEAWSIAMQRMREGLVVGEDGSIYDPKIAPAAYLATVIKAIETRYKLFGFEQRDINRALEEVIKMAEHKKAELGPQFYLPELGQLDDGYGDDATAEADSIES